MSTGAARATADTEILGDPTCRRFLMALWEIGGSTLVVTPTVADELVGNVRQSERRHWRRVLKYDAAHRNHHYDEATYRQIINAARTAAARWVEEELAGQGAHGLLGAQTSMETDTLAEEISASIPLRCFRRPDHPNQRADRQIIGEAIALGYTLLATENLSTIKREPTNQWLIDNGYAHSAPILKIEDATKAMHPNATAEAALDAVLGAALPDHDRGIERDLRTITTFIERLTRTHASVCATWANDALEEVEHPAQLIDNARAHLPQRARKTEARRVRATRRAARDAGYEAEL